MNRSHGKQPSPPPPGNVLPPWDLCNTALPSQVSLEGLLPSVTPAACAGKQVPLWQDSSWGRVPVPAEHYSVPSLMLAHEESHKNSKAPLTASSPVTPAPENSFLKVEAKISPALARVWLKATLTPCSQEISAGWHSGLGLCNSMFPGHYSRLCFLHPFPNQNTHRMSLISIACIAASQLAQRGLPYAKANIACGFPSFNIKLEAALTTDEE